MATLQENYDQKQKEIREQISLLISKLDNHHTKQKANPRNWGFDGDLNYVLENIKIINQFLN